MRDGNGNGTAAAAEADECLRHVRDPQAAASEPAALDYTAEPENRWSLWGVLGSRGVWALSDQAVTSLGNFLTSLILANAVAPAEYGVFVLLFGVVLILNSFHGSLIVYPLSLRGAASDGDRWTLRPLVGGSLLFTAGLFPLLAIALALACWKLNRPDLLPWALAALAFWQLQETLRRALMSRLRHRDALAGDAVSYLGQAGAVAALAWFGALTLKSAFAAMALTSLAAAAIQALQLGLALNGRRELGALAMDYWRHGRWLLLVSLMSILTVQAMPWTLNGFHGSSEVAEFQAVANVLGFSNPVLIGITGLIVPAVAAAARRGQGGHACDVRRVAAKYAWQGAALLLPYFLALALFPRAALSLFYRSQPHYATLTVPLRLFVAAYCLGYLTQVTAAVLNGLGKSRWTFAAHCVGAAATVAISLPLAAAFGLSGAVWGGVLPALIHALVSLWLTGRVLRSDAAGSARPTVVAASA